MIRDAYIKPKLRGNTDLTSFDPVKHQHFTDVTTDQHIFGTYPYEMFRETVLATLILHEAESLSYFYDDVHRLVEIYLGQDTEFARVRELEDLGLVVLLLDLHLPNKMLGPIVQQLLAARRSLARPTWMYSSMSASVVITRLGVDLGIGTGNVNEPRRELERPLKQPEERLDPTSI